MTTYYIIIEILDPATGVHYEEEVSFEALSAEDASAWVDKNYPSNFDGDDCKVVTHPFLKEKEE